ncbi:unnamed protein product, partial [Ectocarpus sp. 13 AM-2016]
MPSDRPQRIRHAISQEERKIVPIKTGWEAVTLSRPLSLLLLCFSFPPSSSRSGLCSASEIGEANPFRKPTFLQQRKAPAEAGKKATRTATAKPAEKKRSTTKTQKITKTE